MQPTYQVAPIFLIRLPGLSFDAIEQLATPETIKAARALAVHNERDADSMARLLETLEKELGPARTALWQSSRTVLAPYLIFAVGGVRQLLSHLLDDQADYSRLTRRNSRAGDRERHLLLYLQRIAAKNDTFSEFGPTGWGKIDSFNASPAAMNAIKIDIRPGIARRKAFLERWTAHSVAAAMNADPAVRSESSPRLHPGVRIEGDQLLFADTGETIKLDARTSEILARCNGSTPAHAIGVDLNVLDDLDKRKMILWEVEVPALDPHPFDTLVADVQNWRESPVREKWLGQLQPIAALPESIIRASGPAARLEIMNESAQRLQGIGVAHTTSSNRYLYSAKNPIGEECFRECGFSVSQDLIDEVAVEAAPWIDFWRDSYAFIAGRVAADLRRVLEKNRSTAMPLPAFLKLCEAAKRPLTGPGLIAPAAIAFQEIKTAFRQRMRPQADAAEYTLTPADCHIVRDNFEYEKFDEYTYPSADLQLAAKSTEAVSRGEYQWVLAELHPPVALLQHCMYWACPDKPALTRALLRTTCHRPNFYFGFFATDFTAHTAIRFFDAVPGVTNFVAPQRGNPAWKTVSPSQAEVYVDAPSGDVCLRKIGAGEYLGSFSRNWIISLGFHPFQFGMSPHTPRLRCGNVIVQRRTWTVTLDELGAGNFKGISRDLVLAIERLRAQRDLPRYIYIRPTEQALRRSGAEGRDKDTKPVFVDLESYLFLEIFQRWLTKSSEIEVTEMLPDPDHLLWKEPDGRRTFELRTLIVPRS